MHKLANKLQIKDDSCLLSIIIVSYNVFEKLIRCLELIIKEHNWEIIVIDNNSPDDSYNRLLNRNFSKNIKLNKNQYNVGFASAVNSGIRESKGKYLLLLNPDTIPSKKEIWKLLNFYMQKERENTNIGLVGGKMISDKGVHGTYVNKPNFFTALFDFTNLKKVFKNNKFSNSFYFKGYNYKNPLLCYGLSGGFLLFNRMLVNEIGYFDENFFMYLEDVDFGVRSRARGFNNYFFPDSSIVHESGSSSSHSIYKINVTAWRESRKYYSKKHFSFLENYILQIAYFLDNIIVDTYHIITKKPLL